MSSPELTHQATFRRPQPQRRRSVYVEFGDGENARVPESAFATENAPAPGPNALRESVDGLVGPIMSQGVPPARARRGSIVRGRSGSMAGGVRTSVTSLAAGPPVALEITKEEIEALAVQYNVSEARVREVAVAAEGEKNLMTAILQSQKESEGHITDEATLEYGTMDTVKRILDFLQLPESWENEVIVTLNECKGDASMCADRIMNKAEYIKRSSSQMDLRRTGSSANAIYGSNIAASSAKAITDDELAQLDEFMGKLGAGGIPMSPSKATLMGEFPTATERQIDQALQLTDQNLQQARAFLRDAPSRDTHGVTDTLEKVMRTNGQRPRPARRTTDAGSEKRNGSPGGGRGSFNLPSLERGVGELSAPAGSTPPELRPDPKPGSAPSGTAAATRAMRARRGSILSPDEPTPTIGGALPRPLSEASGAIPAAAPRRGSTVRLPDCLPTETRPARPPSGSNNNNNNSQSISASNSGSSPANVASAAPKNPRRRGSVAAVNELNLAVLNHQNAAQQGTRPGSGGSDNNVTGVNVTGASPIMGVPADGQIMTPRTKALYDSTFQKPPEKPKDTNSSSGPSTAGLTNGKRANSVPTTTGVTAPSPPSSGSPNGYHRRPTADAPAITPSLPGPAAPAGLPPPPPPPGYKPPVTAASDEKDSTRPAAPAGLPPPPPPPGYKPPVTVGADDGNGPAPPAGLPPPPPPPPGGAGAGVPPPPPPPPPGLGKGGPPPPPPPPPPGLGKGGPPPPPPPPGLGKGVAGGAAGGVAAAPSVTKNIPFTVVKEVKDNSAFAEGQLPLSKDVKEGLLERFKRVDPKKEEAESAASKATQILDANRERNVGIVLQFMRLPIQQLEASIRTFDELTLGEEHISGLTKIIPTESDMRAIARAEKDNGKPWTKEEIQQLTLPVRFFLMTRTIDHYDERIRAWNLKFEFNRNVEDFEAKLQLVQQAEAAVISSPHLPGVLSYLLSFSNVLNEGSRYAEAKAFPISALPTIMNTKTTDGKSTLLECAVAELDDEWPEYHQIVDELLPDVEKARDIDVPAIEVEFQQFRNRLQKCGALLREIPHDKRWSRMLAKFMCKADPVVTRVQKLAKEVDAGSEKVRDYLCESKDTFTLQEAFRILTTFTKRYQIELEKLQDQKKRAALRAEQEHENTETASSGTPSPSKTSQARKRSIENEIISSVPAKRNGAARTRRYSQY